MTTPADDHLAGPLAAAGKTGAHKAQAKRMFLAARRWVGWCAGADGPVRHRWRSLEVAFGRSGMPDLPASLPLGAGRLTREYFGKQDPPKPQAVKAVRRRARHELRDVTARIRWERRRTGVASSRPSSKLARRCGEPQKGLSSRANSRERTWPCKSWQVCLRPSEPTCPVIQPPAPGSRWPGPWSRTR
ncbi:Ppx/GppA phosphatase family protein [Streptomyces sp. 8N706]|uniref:Ppx/GppA phosphatase family protein n=1 Tax=Streptomyces sp. 8N706 TaxID=3457416 RepID=UPI003FD13225